MNKSGMRVSGATGSIEMMKKVDGGSSGDEECGSEIFSPRN